MEQQLQVLLLPFLACLVLTGIHVYLGIHVISRKVIFVDIALAQIAALGATVAFLMGFDPRSGEAYYVSLGFAVFAAGVFALTRTRHERVPQEAVIGLTYATASAAAILLADISPHGAEHLHDLLAGSIIWVTPAQIAKTTALYAVIGLFHYVFRRQFLEISLRPEEAFARGVNVRLWDFLFYLSFGVVITSAVQIAGVLLVFCYLVAPAVFAVMFFEDLTRRLLTGWTMATIVSAIGLFFSYDRPSGPTIMVGFAVALILGGVVRSITQAQHRSRALAITAAASLFVTGAGWTLYKFRPQPEVHGAADSHHAEEAESKSPEHAVGSALADLRAALRDTHENVRANAVRELATTGDLRILPDLIGALHDQSPAVREAAAVELGHVGNPSALPALKQALRNADEDEWVRLRIATTIAGLGDREGLPALLDLAKNGSAKLSRLEALTTLIKLAGSKAAVPSDPNAAEAQAVIKELETWWAAEGRYLDFDPASGTYRRGR